MLWIVVALVAGAVAYGVWVFNRLVHDRNQVAQAFADIDVQLKRRFDLVPRLVEVVRAYAAYERATLEAVVALRDRARQAAEQESPKGLHAERLAAGIGADPVALARGIQEPAVKDRLKALVDESIARGVFGAPTIFVDGEMFWGHDRLPQVERWLATGPF